jgi:hypothetical protein
VVDERQRARLVIRGWERCRCRDGWVGESNANAGCLGQPHETARARPMMQVLGA